MSRAMIPPPYDEERPRWNVTFVGDFATITTTIEANDEGDATFLAADFLQDYYGYDLSKWRADVEEVTA